MKLIVDAMGGDRAPEEIVLGAVRGKERLADCRLVFTGEEKAIRAVLDANGVKGNGIEIVSAPTRVEMEDDPLCILKSKKDSSMARGFALLRDGEGDAFLSAGSTGALMVGASSRVYRNKIPAVRRCAIGTVLPFPRPLLLLDSGANLTVSAEELCQFAVMGSAYARAVMGVEEPAVGLVNNGAEETKGTPVYVETHRLLKEDPRVRFAGNVEPREIPQGACDVLVCDGFSGNLLLKLTEGMGKYFAGTLRSMLTSSFTSRLAALVLKKKVKAFREEMSYEKYGAAPLLGTFRPVLKAHGASSRVAVENAVLQAEKAWKARLGETIAQSLGEA